jgi:hypothetical protein
MFNPDITVAPAGFSDRKGFDNTSDARLLSNEAGASNVTPFGELKAELYMNFGCRDQR